MNYDAHIINYFKLLALIIITTLLNVISILLKGNGYIYDLITSNISEVMEYLVYSFLFFLLGFASWYIYGKIKKEI